MHDNNHSINIACITVVNVDWVLQKKALKSEPLYRTLYAEDCKLDDDDDDDDWTSMQTFIGLWETSFIAANTIITTRGGSERSKNY